MSTTVTLDSDMVLAVQEATNERSKAAAVRKALQEYLHLQRRRKLAALAASVDLEYTNEQLEAMEAC